jgi:hypothetical protein
VFHHVVDAMLWVVSNETFFVSFVLGTFTTLSFSILVAYNTLHALNTLHFNFDFNIFHEKKKPKQLTFDDEGSIVLVIAK